MDPQVGTINYILKTLGLPRSRWFSGPESAMYSIVLVDIWKGMGTYIVLLTAGLLNIPQEIYDSAKVDGANAWQTFWQITIPLLSYTLTLVMVLLAIGSLQVYTSALIMTGGGPGRATYMINLLIVEEAFANLRFGLATAASLVLFAAILVVTAIQLRLTRAGWQY
ncbi:MAG: sugar ABC transporter permease, partial [Anaerolineae bacterium]|nr:sugar ABC transporter permease [Anaerolineae bacterium]